VFFLTDPLNNAFLARCQDWLNCTHLQSALLRQQHEELKDTVMRPLSQLDQTLETLGAIGRSLQSVHAPRESGQPQTSMYVPPFHKEISYLFAYC
jgi:hypothetical protein